MKQKKIGETDLQRVRGDEMRAFGTEEYGLPRATLNESTRAQA